MKHIGKAILRLQGEKTSVVRCDSGGTDAANSHGLGHQCRIEVIGLTNKGTRMERRSRDRICMIATKAKEHGAYSREEWVAQARKAMQQQARPDAAAVVRQDQGSERNAFPFDVVPRRLRSRPRNRTTGTSMKRKPCLLQG